VGARARMLAGTSVSCRVVVVVVVGCRCVSLRCQRPKSKGEDEKFRVFGS
jgi:hypothetical protein